MAQDFGLSEALDGDPGQQYVQQMQAPVPQTPEELEQRKGDWRVALGELNKNPNFLRAMTVMGLKLMQPGANVGSAGLAGMAAFEEGRRADTEAADKQRMVERQGKLDARAEELHGLTVQDRKADMEFQGKRRPLELQKLETDLQFAPKERELRMSQLEQQIRTSKANIANLAADNRRADARLAMEQELRPLQLELSKLKVNRAKFEDSPEGRMSDQERAISSYMQLPEVTQGPNGQARGEAERRALATEKYMMQTRGLTTQMRQDRQDEIALTEFQRVEAMDPEGRRLWEVVGDPKSKELYALGAQIYAGQGGPKPKAGGASGGASTSSSRVIDAATIRKGLEGK